MKPPSEFLYFVVDENGRYAVNNGGGEFWSSKRHSQIKANKESEFFHRNYRPVRVRVIVDEEKND